MGFCPEFSCRHKEGSDGDGRPLQGSVTLHGFEARRLPHLFLASQGRPNAFYHVRRERDGPRRAAGTLSELNCPFSHAHDELPSSPIPLLDIHDEGFGQHPRWRFLSLSLRAGWGAVTPVLRLEGIVLGEACR